MWEPPDILSTGRTVTRLVFSTIANALLALAITAVSGLQPWWVYVLMALPLYGGVFLMGRPGLEKRVVRAMTAVISMSTIKNFIPLVITLAAIAVITSVVEWEGLDTIVRKLVSFAGFVAIAAIAFYVGILSRIAEQIGHLSKKSHFTFAELVLVSGAGAHMLSPRELEEIYDILWALVGKGTLKVSVPDGGDILDRHHVRVSREDLRSFIEEMGVPAPPFLLDGWLNITRATAVQFASGHLRVRKRGLAQLTWLEAHEDPEEPTP